MPSRFTDGEINDVRTVQSRNVIGLVAVVAKFAFTLPTDLLAREGVAGAAAHPTPLLRGGARHLPVDVTAGDSGAMLADVAALERVWERTRPGVVAPWGHGATDSAIPELRRSAGDANYAQM